MDEPSQDASRYPKTRTGKDILGLSRRILGYLFKSRDIKRYSRDMMPGYLEIPEMSKTYHDTRDRHGVVISLIYPWAGISLNEGYLY